MRALVYHGPNDIGVEERGRSRARPGRGAAPHHRDRHLRVRPARLHRGERAAASGPDHGPRDGGADRRRRPRRLRPGPRTGRVATVNPVIGCGECAQCAAGTEQLCPRRKVIGVNREIASAFAELMVAPARNVVVLPGDMPEEYGALVEPLSVGYHAATGGRVGPDDAVLVIGGGPIGQACALAARRLGAEQVVVVRAEHGAASAGRAAGLRHGRPDHRRPRRSRCRRRSADRRRPCSTRSATSRPVGDGLRASSLGARIVLVGMNAPAS